MIDCRCVGNHPSMHWGNMFMYIKLISAFYFYYCYFVPHCVWLCFHSFQFYCCEILVCTTNNIVRPSNHLRTQQADKKQMLFSTEQSNKVVPHHGPTLLGDRSLKIKSFWNLLKTNFKGKARSTFSSGLVLLVCKLLFW